MQVVSIKVGFLASNCHLLCGPEDDVLIVDPGADPDLIAAEIGLRGWRPAAYLLTHGHVDHVHGLAALVARYPAPVGLHPRDAAWAFGAQNAIPPFYDQPVAPPAIERAWAEGQRWCDAGLDYVVLETPGHSPGGVCFYFEKEAVVVSGDCLFQDSVGRTDLPGGDERAMAASLRRLMALPDETKVYCGHGPATTIGREKRDNPFLLAL